MPGKCTVLNDPDVLGRVIRLYREGVAAKVLAEELGVRYGALRHWLMKAGVWDPLDPEIGGPRRGRGAP